MISLHREEISNPFNAVFESNPNETDLPAPFV